MTSQLARDLAVKHATAPLERLFRTRPEGVTQRQWREYFKVFGESCPFWTSEDGTFMSIVIVPRVDWVSVVKFQNPSVFNHEAFSYRRCSHQWAYPTWAGSEYFDGNSGKTRGKVWNTGADKTPFPVIVYELRRPR